MPSMQAAVNTRYGSPEVLRVTKVPKPVPSTGEVLVRIHASTVSRTDCGNLRGHPFFIRAFTGLRRPKRSIRGMDFAGEVAEVGVGVTTFAPGDRVFGIAPDDSGGHAEFLCVPADRAITSMPPDLSFDEAVVCEGALYANTYLRAFGVKPEDTILIYGASGAIGTAAVQLAKIYGAKVTAVVATRHLDLVRSLGADEAIDYTAEDFAAMGQTFDFVLDAVGKVSYFRCRKLLTPNGIFASTDLGPWASNALLALWSLITRRKRVVSPVPKADKEFVELLKTRMEAGKFRAVVDRRYPFEAIVDAYRYVESAKKTGIVVIEVVPSQDGQAR